MCNKNEDNENIEQPESNNKATKDEDTKYAENQAAATLEKTILEIKKLRDEIDSNLEKYKLEIKRLHKDISLGKIPEIFFDKWVPTLIASIILFTAVPLSNDKFWKSQKRIDIGISSLNKMRETYSKLSLVTTQFMQTVERIDILKCNDDPNLDPKEEDRKAECAQLRKDRYTIEPAIVGALSDAEIYFSKECNDKIKQIKDKYNSLERKPPDHDFVMSFGALRQELLNIMKNEILTKENDLLS